MVPPEVCVGSWGVGLLDNDDAADLVSDVRQADPAARMDRLVEPLRWLAASCGYLEAPTANEVAAAALLVAATLDPGLAPAAVIDLIGGLGVLDPSLIGLAAEAARRLRDPVGNEWLELWTDSGEGDTVLLR